MNEMVIFPIAKVQFIDITRQKMMCGTLPQLVVTCDVPDVGANTDPLEGFSDDRVTFNLQEPDVVREVLRDLGVTAIISHGINNQLPNHKLLRRKDCGCQYCWLLQELMVTFLNLRPDNWHVYLCTSSH